MALLKGATGLASAGPERSTGQASGTQDDALFASATPPRCPRHTASLTGIGVARGEDDTQATPFEV